MPLKIFGYKSIMDKGKKGWPRTTRSRVKKKEQEREEKNNFFFLVSGHLERKKRVLCLGWPFDGERLVSKHLVLAIILGKGRKKRAC